MPAAVSIFLKEMNDKYRNAYRSVMKDGSLVNCMSVKETTQSKEQDLFIAENDDILPKAFSRAGFVSWEDAWEYSQKFGHGETSLDRFLFTLSRHQS
ncbi:hypothetical protein N9W34_01600 [Rickettsiales bacterium]|nr:hypothetical protein [Rickettsiales bacterium]